MTNYEGYALNDSTHWEWHTSFAGMHMQHNYRVYHILDAVFNSNPQIESIVEIGTGDGALTTYLALWATRLGIRVLSVDKERCPNTGLLISLGVRSWLGDEWSETVIDSVRNFVKDRPCLFVCDGGCKQREFDYWAPRLPGVSIIAVHDLTTEFNPDLACVEAKTSTTPFMQDRWMEMNAQLAIYKVTRP